MLTLLAMIRSIISNFVFPTRSSNSWQIKQMLTLLNNYLTGKVLSQCSRFQKWEVTSMDEMKAYAAALQTAMGLCQTPELEQYGSQWWLTALKFGDVMSRNR